MGKKDTKHVDKAKLEAKKQRKVQKQEKGDKKRVKKETNEQSIEEILEEFNKKERDRVAITITPCSQPSPRAGFTLTSLQSSSSGSNGDMLLFGGESCDGEVTYVYNDVFRWNYEKNDWKLIESLNTPSPRVSHQSVFYKVSLTI